MGGETRWTARSSGPLRGSEIQPSQVKLGRPAWMLRLQCKAIAVQSFMRLKMTGSADRRSSTAVRSAAMRLWPSYSGTISGSNDEHCDAATLLRDASACARAMRRRSLILPGSAWLLPDSLAAIFRPKSACSAAQSSLKSCVFISVIQGSSRSTVLGTESRPRCGGESNPDE
jgi:hypothetical protein